LIVALLISSDFCVDGAGLQAIGVSGGAGLQVVLVVVVVVVAGSSGGAAGDCGPRVRRARKATAE
jgi:hypothetical protein